jgi:hypothetical protein
MREEFTRDSAIAPGGEVRRLGWDLPFFSPCVRAPYKYRGFKQESGATFYFGTHSTTGSGGSERRVSLHDALVVGLWRSAQELPARIVLAVLPYYAERTRRE